MAKRKTNEQLLINFAKNADPSFVAYAVATLLSAADDTLKRENEIRIQYKDSMIHPNYIIENAKVTKQFLEQK